MSHGTNPMQDRPKYLEIQDMKPIKNMKNMDTSLLSFQKLHTTPVGHAGVQVAQWDFQHKATCTSPP